ncbi:MAG: HIRAN domain-containing protein [Paludibacter sp.]|nr:HIRAN domain-containing protein [Paludibacter sp.]
MIWIIIIIVIAVVIVLINSSSTKDKKYETTLSSPVTKRSDSNEKEMNSLLDKMVSIGLDSLTSLEMTHDEKIDIVENVVNSINENSTSIEQEQKLLLKMATKAYDKILNELKYDENTLETIRNEREDFIAGIADGTVESYPWDELIAWSDGYREYLQNQLDAVEKEIKRRKGTVISSGFANYYINDDNTLKFEVSGLTHLTETELAKVKTLKKNDSKVVLEPEPNNEYDSNAILVKTEDGSKIGYVNKDALPFVHSVIDRITKCQISKLSDHEIPYVWVFIVYDGECLEANND